jgi:hypothetical protein
VIYEMMTALAAAFAARKFPTSFEYGPKQVAPEAWSDHLLVLERDHEAGDTLNPPNGAQSNPRRYANRGLAVKATIWAKSNLDGARINEHQAECEQIIDAFLVSFSEWATAHLALLGNVAPSFQEMRYLKASELPQGGDTWAGVVYQIKFRVNRGVEKRDYEGAARPTGAAATVTGTLIIHRGDQTETVP